MSPYQSTITFTLDTICPWAQLGRVRLLKALSQVEGELHTGTEDNSSPPVVFQLRYAPFQLYPDFPGGSEGVDKHTWYRDEKYGGSEEKVAKYEALMAAYFLAEEEKSSEHDTPSSATDSGVDKGDDKKPLPFTLTGSIANTLPAHHVIQYIQDKNPSEHQNTTAFLDALAQLYFRDGANPRASTTLSAAAAAAGIPEAEVVELLSAAEQDDSLFAETRARAREQAANGVDAVPHVVIEGRRRDITLEGCRKVEEYAKALRTVVRESK